MKKNNLLFISLLLIILVYVFNSCQKDEDTKPITSNDLNLQVNYYKSFQNTIYPCMILGMSNYLITQNINNNFFELSITCPKEECELKIRAGATSISQESITQKTINGKNSFIKISPEINWNYDQLKKLKQPGNVDFVFTAYVDGVEIDNKTMHMSYRSVNECVYSLVDTLGNNISTPWIFAGYVNEDNPNIDKFLQDALKSGIVDSWTGYQEGQEGLFSQLWAIWYHLQEMGVKYSNITETSNPSQKVFSQYVRFFDEVYNNTQANCVDGTVFIASILKKIGIRPFLVLIPGHMFLGYYSDAQTTKCYLLETTLVGSINLGDYYNPYEASSNSFIQATASGSERWNSVSSLIGNYYNYQMIDIEQARQHIQPIAKK